MKKADRIEIHFFFFLILFWDCYKKKKVSPIPTRFQLLYFYFMLLKKFTFIYLISHTE